MGTGAHLVSPRLTRWAVEATLDADEAAEWHLQALQALERLPAADPAHAAFHRWRPVTPTLFSGGLRSRQSEPRRLAPTGKRQII